eukprot:scaffold9850_cov134-Skeletonema_marinoi.AAC.1
MPIQIRRFPLDNSEDCSESLTTSREWKDQDRSIKRLHCVAISSVKSVFLSIERGHGLPVDSWSVWVMRRHRYWEALVLNVLNSAGNQGGFDIIVEFQAGGIDFLHELSEVIELRTKSRQNQKRFFLHDFYFLRPHADSINRG